MAPLWNILDQSGPGNRQKNATGLETLAGRGFRTCKLQCAWSSASTLLRPQGVFGAAQGFWFPAIGRRVRVERSWLPIAHLPFLCLGLERRVRQSLAQTWRHWQHERPDLYAEVLRLQESDGRQWSANSTPRPCARQCPDGARQREKEIPGCRQIHQILVWGLLRFFVSPCLFEVCPFRRGQQLGY